MSREQWENLTRVLAVRLDNIGDAVLLGPALRSMQQAMPHARISLMTSHAGAQVAPLLPWVDEVLVHRAVWQSIEDSLEAPDPEEQYLLANALAERQFDAAFIFTSFSQSPYPPAYVAYLAGIPLRVGQSKEWGGRILTHLVESLPDDAHQADRNLHLLEGVGMDVGRRDLELRVPASATRDATRLLDNIGVDRRRGYVVMAPGASCDARCWPMPRFAEATRQIQQRTGLDVVVAGSAREAPDVQRLIEHTGGRVFSVAGLSGVAGLAAIIEDARLLVTNDSAPMHLAEALGTPMVVLFSGTELRSQFAPRTTPAIVLGKMTACAPCHAFECDRHLECLDVSVEETVDAALSLLPRSYDVAEQRRELVHA